MKRWDGGREGKTDERRWLENTKPFAPAYLHHDEDHERDEDIELRVFPGLGVADVVKLLGDALLGPGPVVQESHQRLLLGELQGKNSK